MKHPWEDEDEIQYIPVEMWPRLLVCHIIRSIKILFSHNIVQLTVTSACLHLHIISNVATDLRPGEMVQTTGCNRYNDSNRESDQPKITTIQPRTCTVGEIIFETARLVMSCNTQVVSLQIWISRN